MEDEIKNPYKLTFYQGLPSSLSPEYGEYFSGYRVNSGQLSGTTSPRTGNIIKAVSDQLNTGIKNVELTLVQTQLLNAVPKQYFKETGRLAKLTGTKLSVHGPVVEPSGVSDRGQFNEENRKAIERQIVETLMKARDLDENGNVVVTFHSAQVLPREGEIKEGKKIIPRSQYVVDRETGAIAQELKAEVKYYPITHEIKEGKVYTKGLKEGGEFYSLQKQLDALNNTKWRNDLNKPLFEKDQADRIIKENFLLVQDFYPQLIAGQLDPKILDPVQQRAFLNMQSAEEHLRDSHSALNAIFHNYYKIASDDEKVELKKISEEFKGDIQEYEKTRNPQFEAQAIQRLIYRLGNMKPQLFEPLNKFAIDKSSQTFGSAAFEAYKKFGDNAPIISIENPPADTTGISRADELRSVIEKSRKEFVNKAVKEGMGERKAQETAEKLIGATWDVGHINLLRRHGFTEEDIVEETGKISPFVKHVHLSDNFGMEHSELPMGMGNVPFEKMMQKLGKNAEKATKVIEAGSFIQFHGATTTPFKESLEGVGSPLYAMKSPYWNQTPGLYQNYYSGLGLVLPQVNYETFGAGFAQLPMELGGSRQTGTGGRVSGTPME